MTDTKTAMTFSIDGLKEVDAALSELNRATARNVARRALRKVGMVIAEAAKALAPDDPATPAPDLHRSIAVSPRLINKRGLSDFANEMAATGDRGAAVEAIRSARRKGDGDAPIVTMFVGPANLPARYAHLVEFGTAHSAAQPFMTPAWEANKNKALDMVADELRKEIAAAAARAARKAARLRGNG